MSQLEAAGIVGPQDAKSKNREVLVNSLEELDVIIRSYIK
jgi:DNA segregation ATPase FtsK/SpoIIIE-like protein